MDKAMRYFNKLILPLFLSMVLLGCSSEDSVDAAGGGSGQGGSLARFTIANNTLYTVFEDNIHVVDITNPADPVSTGFAESRWQIETLFSRGDYLFLGTPFGMEVLDISNPFNPQYVSSFEHAFSCDPVVADDEYAYVTLRSVGRRCGSIASQLNIINVSDITNPQLEHVHFMEEPYGLGIDGDLLFICDNGLKVYDRRSPATLPLLQEFNIPAIDVIPLNGLLLVVAEDGLYQYRYANNELTLLSKVDILPAAGSTP